jgi:preprotein translocase subunit SecG
LGVAQILVALALVATILVQTKGGGLGGIFGQPDSVYRTRRGIERTLFRTTIVLTAVFVILAVVIVNIS